jgi:hypothetical protein
MRRGSLRQSSPLWPGAPPLVVVAFSAVAGIGAAML